MRFRATIASLLTVILLSFSFVASACETRCDLKSVLPSCHSGSQNAQAHAQPTMASMPSMEHTEANSTGQATIHLAVVQVSQVCEHSVCVQQPALLSNDNAVALTHLLPSFVAVAYVAAWMMDAPEMAWRPVVGSTLARSSSPVALHTTLRV